MGNKKVMSKLGLRGGIAVLLLGFCISTVEYIPDKTTTSTTPVLKNTNILNTNNLVAYSDDKVTEVSTASITKVSDSVEASGKLQLLSLSDKATKKKVNKKEAKYKGLSTGSAYTSTNYVAIKMLEGNSKVKLKNYKLTPKQLKVTIDRLNKHPLMLVQVTPKYIMHDGKNNKYVKEIEFKNSPNDLFMTRDKQDAVLMTIDDYVKSSKFKKMNKEDKHKALKSYVNKHIKLSYSANKAVKKKANSKNIVAYNDANNVYAVLIGKGTKTAKMRVYDLMAKRAGLTTHLTIKYNDKKYSYSTALTKTIGKKKSKVKF